MKNNFEPYIDKYPKGPIHLLIPGHGGLDENGIYQIAKKGSKQAMVDGQMIYEGHLNRKIVREIIEQRSESSRVTSIVPEVEDISRPERIDRINKASAVFKKAGFFPLVWEVHLNAFNKNAFGTECYTTRGENLSDDMAAIWWDKAIHIVGGKHPDYKWRHGGPRKDPSKEKNYDIIYKSHAYGILIEFYFFDHKWSVDMFNNPYGHSLWASTVIAAINEIDSYWEV